MLVFPCRAIAAAGAITSRAAVGALVVAVTVLVIAGGAIAARAVARRTAVNAAGRVRDMNMLAGGAVGAAAPVTG
jgi:uncharacterized protein YcfJ